MTSFVIKSHAKINLSLGVIEKIDSEYHKIESLISFLKFYDEISIEKIKNKSHKVEFFGKFSKGIGKYNTVTKLLGLLDKKKCLNNQKYLIKIKKNIPQKSGMGGGSMNASTIISYFKNKNIIRLTDNEINKMANLIGSDVILGLEKKNSILFSDGNVLRVKNKLNLYTLVVKPNFGCSTKEIYSKIRSFSSKNLKRKKANYFKISIILNLKNDLEKIVLKKYPKLQKLKLFMEKLPNVKIVRMSGSGSTFIAYFKSKNASINAAKLLKRTYKNYWCILSKTI